MKIKITYIPEEEQDAAKALAALLAEFPLARIRRSEFPPTKIVYLTVRTLRHNFKSDISDT